MQVKYYPNKENLKKLQEMPNKITYEIARRTLDMTVPHIPKDTGLMRGTSTSAGVRGTDGNYWIGSYTRYADKVWNYENVNWTTPNTFGKWYERVYKQYGKSIVQNTLERNKV